MIGVPSGPRQLKSVGLVTRQVDRGDRDADQVDRNRNAYEQDQRQRGGDQDADDATQASTLITEIHPLGAAHFR
jgi:hypothetical protein